MQCALYIVHCGSVCQISSPNIDFGLEHQNATKYLVSYGFLWGDCMKEWDRKGHYQCKLAMHYAYKCKIVSVRHSKRFTWHSHPVVSAIINVFGKVMTIIITIITHYIKICMSR